MPDYPFDFDVPVSKIAPGSLTILGWSNAVVSINKLNIPEKISIQIDRNLNVGAGTCKLRILDPERLYYDMFQPQDEIEIFFSHQTGPGTYIGRKVWGGYLDQFATSIDNGTILEVSGKEYISRLQSQTYSGTLSGAFNTKIGELLSNQGDFTYEGVTDSSITDTVSATVTNDAMYNVMKQLSDQVGAYFWIDPETRDVQARRLADIPVSPDEIVEGINLLPSSNANKNSEYMTNSLIINYNGGATTAVTDATSITNRGTFGRTVTLGNVDNATEAQAYGTTTVGNRKDPSDAFQLSTLYLPYTDPGAYVLVSSPTLGINGAHQVTQISHAWSKNDGIKTTVNLGAQFIDKDLYLADLERRLRITERKTFTGT